MPGRRKSRRAKRDPFKPHHPHGDADLKELDVLTKDIAQIHRVANSCLSQARWATSIGHAAVNVRNALADPHSKPGHDPELARAAEKLASARESVLKSADTWKELAERADRLAADILSTKRSDIDRTIAVDHADAEVERLMKSHDERIDAAEADTKKST